MPCRGTTAGVISAVSVTSPSHSVVVKTLTVMSSAGAPGTEGDVTDLEQGLGVDGDAGFLLDLTGGRLIRGLALLNVPAEGDDLAGAKPGLLVTEEHLTLTAGSGPGQQAQARGG